MQRKMLGIFLSIAMSLLLAACGEDPARSMKILSPQPAAVTTVYVPPRGPERNLLPEFCPPPEDSPGPGRFTATGPCAFQHRALVSCESAGDDFIVGVPRKAKNGAMLVVYLNVEHYHGPGVYDGAQIFVAAENGETIYRWSNDNVHATVGPDEAFVSFPRTRLEQEPVRVACSRLIGPDSNYTYQCAAASGANLAMDSAPEIVSGKLQCTIRRSGSKH